MTDLLIIAVLLLAAVLAIMRSIKHFRGGGCCGSSSSVVREKKTLSAPVLFRKTLSIEGMHCQNCAVRVESAVNRIDGAACRVNLRRKTAVVSCSADIPDQQLISAVEAAGYQVSAVRRS